MKRKLRRLGLIVLGLVILMLCASGIASIVFARQLNAEIAAIKAKGEPVTPAELMGRPIPDAENAAAVYGKAWRRLVSDPATKPHFRVLERLDLSSIKPNDTAKWQAAERALAGIQTELDMIDRAASMPRCRFYVDWSSDYDAAMPTYVSGVRKLGRLKLISAEVNAHAGRIDEALGDTITLFRMAKAMENSPMLIPQITRVALLSMAAKGVTSTAERGDITERQAQVLFNAAGDIDVAQGFKRAWEGERVYTLHAYSPEGFDRTVVAEARGSSVRRLAARVSASFYSHTLLRRDLTVYLASLAPQVDGVGLSFRQAKTNGLFDEPDTAFDSLASVFGPERYATQEKLARTQVFLALQAYNARYGAYPATMQELKSKLGWKSPVDPFSGKDFIYKRQAKGFILYSVGPDMKDDGGRAVPDNKVSSINDKGDIVLKWDR